MIRDTLPVNLLLLITLVCTGLFFGCKNLKSAAWANFKAGQKLNGRYEHGVLVESYIFKEDGTYKHEDAGDKNNASESGTYHIDGEMMTLESGGKSVSKKVSAPGNETDKQSPSKIDLNFTTYDLVSDSQLAARRNSSTDSANANTAPAEFAKFAPARVGDFALMRNSLLPPDPKQDSFKEGIRFFYESKNYFDIRKYASEADAGAAFKKRISQAVAADEYDKKVKLPKCDPNKETDYETPEVLAKTIPQKSGDDAVVFQSSRFWDYQCRIDSNREETVVWTNGVYIFQINTSAPDIHSNAFGKAEAFFNDYQRAMGQ